MGNDLDILEKMIASPPLEKYELSKGQIAIPLIENDGISYTVTINNLGADCVSIKGDSFDFYEIDKKNNSKLLAFFGINKRNDKRKAILKGENGEKRKVDYIIIAENNNQRNIFYVELKSENFKNKKIREKMKGSKSFMKYIFKIGQEFWGGDGFLSNGEYTARYVLIAKKRGGKITRRQKLRGTGKNKWQGTGESPEEFLLIPRAAVLEFSDLLVVGAPRTF